LNNCRDGGFVEVFTGSRQHFAALAVYLSVGQDQDTEFDFATSRTLRSVLYAK
jgi:hypothetical protein